MALYRVSGGEISNANMAAPVHLERRDELCDFALIELFRLNSKGLTG